MGNFHRKRVTENGGQQSEKKLGKREVIHREFTGRLRGVPNIASWVVAGTLAYFLWVKPSQDLKRQQQDFSFPLKRLLWPRLQIGVVMLRKQNLPPDPRRICWRRNAREEDWSRWRESLGELIEPQLIIFNRLEDEHDSISRALGADTGSVAKITCSTGCRVSQLLNELMDLSTYDRAASLLQY
ncbi:LOW QUALITY PROTEIN: hypothetical protein RJ641_032634, partial [Dillenia turbinata]